MDDSFSQEAYQGAVAVRTANIARYSVAILDRTSNAPVVGSGTLVTLGGRVFVATAGHVAAAHTERCELFGVHGLEHVAVLDRGSSADEKAVDVGWLELDRDQAARLGLQCIGPGRLRVAPRPGAGTELAVFGLPAEDALALQGGTLRPKRPPHCVHTEVVPPLPADTPSTLRLRYRADGFALASGEPLARLRDAPGMSGGGIWTTSMPSGQVWSPESSCLMGIEHAWIPDENLRGTLINEWLELLISRFPELRTQLDETLAGLP